MDAKAQSSSLVWVWVLLAVAGLGALGYFVIYPWFTQKDDKNTKKDANLLPKPTVGTTSSNMGTASSGNTGVVNTGNSHSSGGGNTSNSGGGNTPTGSVLALYQANQGTKVVNLARGSYQAKLAQYIIKEGLKANGLTDNVGSIDGKIGDKTKAGMKAVYDTLTYWLGVPAKDMTLKQLATIVNAKISGENEPVETGVARITYDSLK